MAVGATGKTFLAWSLAHEKNAVFFASPFALAQSDFVNDSASLVIIDNGASETGELRHLLAELQMRNGRYTLIITRQPNQIGLPLIHLPPPTSQDNTIVYHNLSLLEHYALPPLTKRELMANYTFNSKVKESLSMSLRRITSHSR
ncbi:MAG: hypothetical protein M5U34_09495 [Chloroflexi bacterium]|nr:hypothetical protein [Chloroflexota bacterium]